MSGNGGREPVGLRHRNASTRTGPETVKTHSKTLDNRSHNAVPGASEVARDEFIVRDTSSPEARDPMVGHSTPALAAPRSTVVANQAGGVSSEARKTSEAPRKVLARQTSAAQPGMAAAKQEIGVNARYTQKITASSQDSGTITTSRSTQAPLSRSLSRLAAPSNENTPRGLPPPRSVENRGSANKTDTNHGLGGE